MIDQVFGISDLGKRRQNNEDSLVAQPAHDGRYLIGSVIDGVGGYSGGEIAAEIARETLVDQLTGLSGEVIPALTGAFAAANERIWQEKHASQGHKSMACVLTLAVADLETNQFYYAHLGDTRLYLFRDGSLVKISHDQSFVGFLEDSGRLSETEAMRHPKRNEIDKALGFKHDINNGDDIETGQSPFLPGDLLLLCTDGLTDVVDKAAITAILSQGESLEKAGRRLIDAANDGGGPDNITVVLVRNNKTKQQYAATRPAENKKEDQQKKMSTENDNTKPVSNSNNANPPQRSYKGLAIFFFTALSVVCIMRYFKGDGATKVSDSTAIVQKPRNAQEVKLMNAIYQNKNKIVVLSDTAFKSPIILTRSIIIDQDSLQIKAKGNITFQKDSTLKSPAFIISANTRKVVFDSVTFKNFPVAIQGRDQSLWLKNVRFTGCMLPVDNAYLFRNGNYVNGNLATPQFKDDISPVKTK